MSVLHRRGFLAGAITLAASARAFAQSTPGAVAPAGGPFRLDPLPYAANKNEPHIDAQTMEIHHGRHHAAYVNNLNQAATQGGDWASKPLHELLASLNSLPEAIRTLVRNNGGGHANHTMFWQIMGGSGSQPQGELAQAITRDFTSLDKLKADFNAAGGRVFGSGWVFITVAQDGKLALVSKPNQDSPLMDGQRALMGNDVWEHAYYLKYQNRRADYLQAWWNVVDWAKVGERYAAAKAGRLTI